MLLLLVGMIISSKAQISSGLISQYYFFGNANDMVGTNNGIVRGATLAPDRFGNPNAAYCFNGVNNLINLGTSSSLKTTTMSISLWAKITSYTNTSLAYVNQPFITTRSRNAVGAYEAYFMGIYKPSSVLDAATSSTLGSQSVILSSATANLNVWNHLVYMFKNDSTWLYINGVFQQKAFKGYVSGYLAGDSVLLGYVGSGPSTYSWLNGCLDDIRIYNRMLNQADISTLYTEVNNPLNIGMKNATSFQYELFPNPSNGKITLKGLSSENYEITVFNAIGEKIVDTDSRSLKQNEIDLSSNPKGIYFVELRVNDQKVTKKLILQ